MYLLISSIFSVPLLSSPASACRAHGWFDGNCGPNIAPHSANSHTSDSASTPNRSASAMLSRTCCEPGSPPRRVLQVRRRSPFLRCSLRRWTKNSNGTTPRPSFDRPGFASSDYSQWIPVWSKYSRGAPLAGRSSWTRLEVSGRGVGFAARHVDVNSNRTYAQASRLPPKKLSSGRSITSKSPGALWTMPRRRYGYSLKSRSRHKHLFHKVLRCSAARNQILKRRLRHLSNVIAFPSEQEQLRATISA